MHLHTDLPFTFSSFFIHIVVQTQYNILFKLHNHIQIREGGVTPLRPLEVYNSIAVKIKYFKYNS